MRAYVMELLEGKSLTADLELEQPLALERTYRIARQVADALAAVHDHGIVHRDLKPDNIFLMNRRRQPDFVKVLDFGVAKLLETTELDMRTQAGTLLGTPAYISPEQSRGDDVDARADIYSFGVILYQMVTGVRPFKAKSLPELLLKHASETPRAPSTIAPVPAGLEELILRCMAKSRDDRPRDMHIVERALAALERGLQPELGAPFVDDGMTVSLSDVPTHAVAPVVLPPDDDVPAPRGRTTIALAGVTLVALIAAASWLLARPAADDAAHDPSTNQAPAHDTSAHDAPAHEAPAHDAAHDTSAHDPSTHDAPAHEAPAHDAAHDDAALPHDDAARGRPAQPRDAASDAGPDAVEPHVLR